MAKYDPKKASPQAIIERLWLTGHYDNPDHPTGIKRADLAKQTLYSPETRIAMASFTEMMAEVAESESFKIHGRRFRFDGDFGPATEATILADRCEYPDYYVPELELYEGYQALGAQEEAVGKGSWPANCHPDWPGVHTFTVQVNKSRMPSFLGSKDDPNSMFEKCFARQREAYADMGIVFIREDSNNKANTLVTWEKGKGWIGLAIVPNQFSCGSRIWAKFDTVYQPGNMFDQWSRLLCHEFGHNMGMSHSRGGIMNPSISSGVFTPTAWRGDPSEAILKRNFGGVPVPIGGPKPPPGPGPDPDPKPDPTPGRMYFTGSLTAHVDGVPVGEFILSPKPRL